MATYISRSLLPPVLFSLSLMAVGSESGGDTTATPWLRFDPTSAELTLRVEETPLAEVLDAIAKSTDVEFIHAALGEDLVTVNFQRLPIVDALKRLLSHRSYMIQLDPGSGRPERVWIMARGTHVVDAPPERKAHPVVPPRRAPREKRLTEVQELFDQITNGSLSDEEAEQILRTVIESEDSEVLDELLSTPLPVGQRE